MSAATAQEKPTATARIVDVCVHPAKKAMRSHGAESRLTLIAHEPRTNARLRAKKLISGTKNRGQRNHEQRAAHSLSLIRGLRRHGQGDQRTTNGQFRLTVTPSARTTAWKTNLWPRGSPYNTLASPPIDAHQWL